MKEGRFRIFTDRTSEGGNLRRIVGCHSKEVAKLMPLSKKKSFSYCKGDEKAVACRDEEEVGDATKSIMLTREVLTRRLR